MFLFKKIRYLSWLTQGFLRKHSGLITFSLFLGVIGFFLANWFIPTLQKTFHREKIGLVGQFTLSDLPPQVASRLSRGLTAVAPDGQPLPDLADHWEVSDDGKTYTFYLKDSLTWVDQSPLKAGDLAFQFKDVEVEVVNDQTLRFKLKDPYSPFPVLLSQPVFKKGLIGVGPARVARVKTNGQLVESLTLKEPKKTLIVRFYPTEKAALTGLKLGEVDRLLGLFSPTLSPDWQSFVQIEEETDTTKFVGLFYNNNDSYLASKPLRQALTYAIKDKPRDSRRALGPLRPNSWAYNPHIKRYDYHPDSARKLFKKFQEEGEKQEKLNLTIATAVSYLDLAEKIKASWEELLPVSVEVKVINSLSEDFQILLIAQEIPPDPDQYTLWHSTQPGNISHFNSPKVDKLLEDGRKTYDLAERKEIYQEFQKALVEECPVAFLFYPTVYHLSRR